MAGWFELSGGSKGSKGSNDGQFRFVLKAGNGEVILSSESYSTKAAAQRGIASVQANSPNDARYERKTSSNGKPFFNLRAANHKVIGNSELYNSESARENGIASVKKNGATTDVRDRT